MLSLSLFLQVQFNQVLSGGFVFFSLWLYLNVLCLSSECYVQNTVFILLLLLLFIFIASSLFLFILKLIFFQMAILFSSISSSCFISGLQWNKFAQGIFFFFLFHSSSYPTKDQYIQKCVVNDYGMVAYFSNMIYRYIPFLYEMNCLIDWSVSETACDLWNYMRIEEIKNTMFIAKYKVILITRVLIYSH